MRLTQSAPAEHDETSDSPSDDERRDVRPRRDFLRTLPVGLVVFLGVVLVVALRNRWLFTEGRVEDGDFAVNSILIDEARHFRLLVGNYSRVGFNHPGPALLYVQAWSQLLLHDLIPLFPRPYNAHVFGIVALNAGLAGCCATIVTRALGRRLAGAAVGVAALVLAWIQPGVLVSTWMPDVYVWPFILLAVAVAAVLAGSRRDLPFLALAVGLLVHGHVSFVMFCAVATVAVVVAEVVGRARHAEAQMPRSALWATTCILALFALPIIANLILHWPGEFDDYWRYSRHQQEIPRTVGDAVAFVARYWAPGRMGAAVSLGLVVGALAASRAVATAPARRFLTVLVVVAVGLSSLGVVYAYRGVDYLSFDYVGRFIIGMPVVVILAAALAAGATHVNSRRPRAAAATALACIALGSAASPGQVARYQGARWIKDATRAIEASAPPGTTFVLQFPGEQWPASAGIVEDARRADVDICVNDPGLEFLFSAAAICDDDERARGVPVHVGPSPAAPNALPIGARVVYEGSGVMIDVRTRTP